MFGALPAGVLADCIGRKWSLLSNNVLVVVGVVLECFAINPYMLIVGRFVMGINSGTLLMVTMVTFHMRSY